MKKYQNLMLTFLVGIFAVVVSGCADGTSLIQVNLGPASSRSVRRPAPIMATPRMVPPQNSGYPAAGGDGGYYAGYGQPSYGFEGGCRQPFVSRNMLMRNGRWVSQDSLRFDLGYFIPVYPDGFLRGNSRKSGCHRQPPPPPPPRPHRRHHR